MRHDRRPGEFAPSGWELETADRLGGRQASEPMVPGRRPLWPHEQAQRDVLLSEIERRRTATDRAKGSWVGTALTERQRLRQARAERLEARAEQRYRARVDALREELSGLVDQDELAF
jgi:hypothetical protein